MPFGSVESLMSRVQGKNADILNNLTETGIANELDSHLRDLEKNIAVAREFIKLADESYTELRHKWNLIQEEARNKTETGISEKATSATRKKRSQTDSLAEPEDSAISTPEKLVGTSIGKTPNSEKSKSRNKHEKIRKQSADAQETPHSTVQPDSVKPSKDHGSKPRRDKVRSSTN